MSRSIINKRYPHFSIADLVGWCKGTTGLSATQLSRRAGTVLNDSRHIASGDIFLALKTENNDGHQFIDAAFKAGASAAIASKKAHFSVSPRYRNRIIYVNNPLKAIQRAARSYRKALGILMIGITGSSGKTTTRSFIAQVLRQSFAVGETWSNWNNHIGVPLSILKFAGNEWLGVIEMGANHSGEIHQLSSIARPDIAVITNIGYAHVGLFGSLTKTTEAKFEIIDGMNKRKGFLLINGDDSRLVAHAKKSGFPTLSFGCSRRCSIVAESIKVDPEQGIHFHVDGMPFTMKMPGRHFIYSALPAIFMGRRCGLSDNDIACALASIEPVALRGTVEPIGDTECIVDCYNANPSSMESALDYLNDVAEKRRKVAVLGEMLELGRYTKQQHKRLGTVAAHHNVDRLIAVGPSAALIALGAQIGGMSTRTVQICDNADDAVRIARSVIKPGDTVLLKGSRGVQLEKIYNAMKEQR